MIIGEIRRYLRDNNSIRVSRSLRDIAYKAIYTRENYMKQHLKEPTVTEIAQEIGIKVVNGLDQTNTSDLKKVIGIFAAVLKSSYYAENKT